MNIFNINGIKSCTEQLINWGLLFFIVFSVLRENADKTAANNEAAKNANKDINTTPIELPPPPSFINSQRTYSLIPKDISHGEIDKT